MDQELTDQDLQRIDEFYEEQLTEKEQGLYEDSLREMLLQRKSQSDEDEEEFNYNSDSSNGSVSSLEIMLDGPLVPVDLLMDSSKSVCKIVTLAGTGTGFLVKFETAKKTVRSGLLTNYHVLPKVEPNSRFILQFPKKVHQKAIDVTITKYMSIFQCPLLDVTFIRFRKNELPTKLRFLPVSFEAPKNQQPVFLLQYPLGRFSFATGIVSEVWGIHFRHTVSTNYGSSGGPILDTDGSVIGIHHRRILEIPKNVGTSMAEIRNEIVRYPKKTKIPGSVASLETLPLERLRELNLTFCAPFSNILDTWCFQDLSPPNPSDHVSHLWFARTYHGWYWTPTMPKTDPNAEQPNWMHVRLPCVIGGHHHGHKVSPNCLFVIEYLRTLIQTPK